MHVYKIAISLQIIAALTNIKNLYGMASKEQDELIAKFLAERNALRDRQRREYAGGESDAPSSPSQPSRFGGQMYAQPQPIPIRTRAGITNEDLQRYILAQQYASRGNISGYSAAEQHYLNLLSEAYRANTASNRNPSTVQTSESLQHLGQGSGYFPDAGSPRTGRVYPTQTTAASTGFPTPATPPSYAASHIQGRVQSTWVPSQPTTVASPYLNEDMLRYLRYLSEQSRTAENVRPSSPSVIQSRPPSPSVIQSPRSRTTLEQPSPFSSNPQAYTSHESGMPATPSGATTSQNPGLYTPFGHSYEPPARFLTQPASSVTYSGEDLPGPSRANVGVAPSETSARERWMKNLNADPTREVSPFIEPPDKSKTLNQSIDALAKRITDHMSPQMSSMQKSFEDMYLQGGSEPPTPSKISPEMETRETIWSQEPEYRKSASFKEALLKPAPISSPSKNSASEHSVSPASDSSHSTTAARNEFHTRERTAPSSSSVNKPADQTSRPQPSVSYSRNIRVGDESFDPSILGIQFGSFQRMPSTYVDPSLTKLAEEKKPEKVTSAPASSVRINDGKEKKTIPQDTFKEEYTKRKGKGKEPSVTEETIEKEKTPTTDNTYPYVPHDWCVLVIPIRHGIGIDVQREINLLDYDFKYTNTKLFPSGAVLVICESREEADYLRKAVNLTDTIRVKPKRIFPLEVLIHNVPNESTESQISRVILLKYDESPLKVLFTPYNNKRKRNFKFATVEVRSTLRAKMEAAPCIQLGERFLRIDTSIRVDRCSRCRLLGHRDDHCRDVTRPAPLPSDPCLDCTNYNALNRKAKLEDRYFRNPNHPTGDDICPTKRHYEKKWRRNQESVDATETSVRENSGDERHRENNTKKKNKNSGKSKS